MPSPETLATQNLSEVLIRVQQEGNRRPRSAVQMRSSGPDFSVRYSRKKFISRGDMKTLM